MIVFLVVGFCPRIWFGSQVPFHFSARLNHFRLSGTRHHCPPIHRSTRIRLRVRDLAITNLFMDRRNMGVFAHHDDGIRTFQASYLDSKRSIVIVNAQRPVCTTYCRCLPFFDSDMFLDSRSSTWLDPMTRRVGCWVEMTNPSTLNAQQANRPTQLPEA
jgi:hypothetical protein